MAEEKKVELPDFKGVEVIRAIGVGSYGSVYEVFYEGKERALKVYKDSLPELIEIDTLSRIRHPNIIPILKVLNEEDFGVIMPLGDMTLRRYLQESRPLETRLRILYKIVNAVDFLLDQNILPFDLHSSNVVMMGDEPLIIDTGMARRVDCRGTTVTSSFTPMRVDLVPPENVQDLDSKITASTEYSEASIVWGLGILAYNILSSGKETRYSREALIQMRLPDADAAYRKWIDSYMRGSTSVRSLFQKQVPDPGDKMELILDLAVGMLNMYPERRLAIRDILQHPLFTGLKSYPVGRVTSSDFTLYPEMKEDVKVLVKSMLDDARYAETRYGKESLPSSAIFGAVYAYQRFLSIYGKENKYRIAVPLQMMYNLYGWDESYLVPSLIWEGKPLTDTNSYVKEMVAIMEGIIHPITDYDSAFTKLVGSKLSFEAGNCPKPSFDEVAGAVLGPVYDLPSEVDPIYFAVLSYDANVNLEDAMSLRREDLESPKIHYYIHNNMYSQLGQMIQSLLNKTLVTEPGGDGYLYYQSDLSRAEDYVSNLLYKELHTDSNIEHVGEQEWRLDGIITIVNLYGS